MLSYAFAVEGHTDRIPLTEGSSYRSNWELSTARAHAVRSRLEATGVHRNGSESKAADTNLYHPMT